MREKLQVLYYECLEELKRINIDINSNQQIGEIDIKISPRKTKRYGCCKHEEPENKSMYIEKRGRKKYIKYERFNKHHIEISEWVLNLNESIIKNTIMHELIHCLPRCNNHGEEFKKYANYINQNLGYNISRLGNKEEDYKLSNLNYDDLENSYKYKIICKKCSQQIYRKRLKKHLTRKYRCGKCGGLLKIDI